MAKKKYYAVKHGINPGVYDDWESCKAQVNGYSGAEYKSFTDKEEALAFVCGETSKDIVATDSNQTNTDMFITIPYAFVDGSFNQKTGVYGYGGFLCVGDVKYPLMGAGCKPDMVSMRNVAGEISGSMAAVKKAEELGLREIKMFYDYKGIEHWATGSWQTNRLGTQEYAEFMKPENRKVKVEFQHVKGHSGVEGNEMADIMAKKAVGIPLTKKQQTLYDSLDCVEERKKDVTHRSLPSCCDSMRCSNDKQFE